MKSRIRFIALCGFAYVGLAILVQASDTLEQNIYTVAYPRDQKAPFPVPCCAESSVLISVPYKITGWAGRGFIPQDQVQTAGEGSATTVVGDFSLFPGKLTGYKEFAVSALVGGGTRTFHIIMEGDHVLTLEFIVVASEAQAFRRVKFVDTSSQAVAVAQAVQNERAERAKASAIKREDDPPESRYVAPSAQTENGIRIFARALMGLSRDRAEQMIAANPALQGMPLNNVEESGDYTIIQRYAIRDDVTDTLAVAVSLKNNTGLRLYFDPQGWIIRSGSRVYPVPTLDFAGVLEPNESSLVVLVLSRDQYGEPTRLLPSSPFRIAGKIRGRASAKPVTVSPLGPTHGD